MSKAEASGFWTKKRIRQVDVKRAMYIKEVKAQNKKKINHIECECGACFADIYWKYCPKCKKLVKEILLEEQDEALVRMIEDEIQDDTS